MSISVKMTLHQRSAFSRPVRRESHHHHYHHLHHNAPLYRFTPSVSCHAQTYCSKWDLAEGSAMGNENI